MTLQLEGAKGGDRTASGGEFVPVPDCAGGKDVASVVCEASLVLEAVVASSSTCRLEFEVRAPHTHLTSGDLVQRMVRRTFILSVTGPLLWLSSTSVGRNRESTNYSQI